MKIQGAITYDALIVMIVIILLPMLLSVLLPLFDYILNDNVISFINDGIENIEYFIGSANTNILFILIAMLIIMPIIRWFISFLNGNNIHDN